MIEEQIEGWVHWQLVSSPRTAAWFGFRVTPIVATQGTTRGPDGSILPFAAYKAISTEVRPYLDLSVPEAAIVQVSIEIYAETYDAAKAAAAATRAVLHRATGKAYGNTVYFSLLQSASDDIAVPVDGKGVPLYAVTQTYEIRSQESI